MLVREVRCDFSLDHRASPRTPGQHVSEVIRDIALKMGVLKQDDKEELDWTLARYRLACGDPAGVSTLFPTAISRVALGLAWEQWVGEQWEQINFHSIGELEKDGLIGTPDGLEFWLPFPPGEARGHGAIHEIKLTWKSSRSDREKPQERLAQEFLWLAQTKAYCEMASQPGFPVLQAMLHVYWVNGNYRGSGPEPRSYELRFTEEELRKNWYLIRESARVIREQEERERQEQEREQQQHQELE